MDSLETLIQIMPNLSAYNHFYKTHLNKTFFVLFTSLALLEAQTLGRAAVRPQANGSNLSEPIN